MMKVRNVFLTLLGIGTIGGVCWFAKKTLGKSEKMSRRYREYYSLTNQWLKNKNEKKNIVDYFKNNGYSSIAIYGMGEMGSRLFEELQNTDIKVVYFIDNRRADEMYFEIDNIPIISSDEIENQEEVDAIVVTPIYDFEAIEEALMEHDLKAEIVSLEDVIYEI